MNDVVNDIPRHPLDGGPPAIVMPSLWTAEWVGYRLIMAFKVLARAPGARGPRGYGSGMPAYVYTLEDIEAQRETPALKIHADSNAESESMQILRAMRNRPSPPTSRELEQMEQALAWPGAHLRGFPGFAGCLNAWAQAAAREIDFADWLYGKRSKISPEIGGFIAREAMRIIADRLRKERVEVS